MSAHLEEAEAAAKDGGPRVYKGRCPCCKYIEGHRANCKQDFITITHGMRGYFAVHMTWSDELGGFYEPEQTGLGSYHAPDAPALLEEAKEWAAALAVEFRP